MHKSLELVPLLFGFLGGVKKIDGKRLLPNCQRTVNAVDSAESVYHDCEEAMEETMGRKGVLWMSGNKVSEEA